MNLQTQRGAALIVGLVLMVALTILAISAMRMTRSQILMAGNDQFDTQALNAAEAAINAEIASGRFNSAIVTPGVPTTALVPTLPGTASATSTSLFINRGSTPDGGFSDDVLAYRFRIDASGQAPTIAPRARVNLRQGLYVLAPGN